VLIPYATGVGFLRIYAEDRSNLWGVPVASFSSYSYTIGISLLFTLLQVALYEGLFFFNEWVKAHQEREELQHLNVQMQLEALKVQVQPHFLFNTINTLVSLIEKDQERAVHFAESLSDVYRYFLQANQTQLINLEKEIQFCEIYFSLLKTRFPDGLYLHNFLNGCSYYELPPLTIQSLIENAVKHNVISASRSLHITIDFLPTTQRIIVTNNLQPRAAGAFLGKGLQYITEKFRLLNLPPVSITKDEKLFSVSFPIIKTYAHESYDH
jgi:LytS/YehU family sensor histidine kinase